MVANRKDRNRSRIVNDCTWIGNGWRLRPWASIQTATHCRDDPGARSSTLLSFAQYSDSGGWQPPRRIPSCPTSRFTGGKVHIVDHASANGTFVDGTRIRPGETRIARPGFPHLFK